MEIAEPVGETPTEGNTRPTIAIEIAVPGDAMSLAGVIVSMLVAASHESVKSTGENELASKETVEEAVNNGR